MSLKELFQDATQQIEKDYAEIVRKLRAFLEHVEKAGLASRLETNVLSVLIHEVDVRQKEDLALLTTIRDLAGYIDALTEAVGSLSDKVSRLLGREPVIDEISLLAQKHEQVYQELQNYLKRMVQAAQTEPPTYVQ